MPNHIETLIADVLAYSRPSGSGCFVTNAAADDLLKCGQAALNEIEGAIRALLAQSDRSASHDELLEAQLGLLDLWMVYFQLAEGND